MPAHALLEKTKVPQREPPYKFPADSVKRKVTQDVVETKNEKMLDTVTREPQVVTTPVLPTQDDLPSCDGVPMETERHKKQMDLLIYSLEPWLGERGYVGGNMFVYFSTQHLKNKDFRGPDVFVTLGLSNKERKSWVVWDEGKSPDIIIELLSESTAEEDKNSKKQIYQDQLKVAEYFWFDPYNPEDFKGFWLNRGVYEEMPLKDESLLCKQLGLTLKLWRGVFKNIDTVWLRWATLEGEWLLLPDEAEAQRAEAEAQRAETEAQRAEAEAQRAEQERQQKEQAQKRAEAEAQRAERLAQILREQGMDPDQFR